MTIMGMAASQARFLGLTARKSNVEYQGQQINQQRTALANESANLYNQMLELTVPTPPSSNDFYQTVYTLDNSQESYDTSNYVLSNPRKTYKADQQYEVTLTHDVEIRVGKTATYQIQSRTPNTKKGGYDLHFSNNNFMTTVNFKEDDVNPYKENVLEDNTGNEVNDDVDPVTTYTLDITPGQFYQLTKEQLANDDCAKPTGYEEWLTFLGNDAQEITNNGCYFYKDDNNNYFFLSNADFAKINTDNASDEDRIHLGSSYTYEKPYSTIVTAMLESSPTTGRYCSITIANDPNYPAILQNQTFSISTTRTYDEKAYQDAMNDYEFEKARYDKAVSDINSQTEVIQNQDQQLELRVEQLDTEQNAIKTEMDSVSKVIEDNVEKTFKVFA